MTRLPGLSSSVWKRAWITQQLPSAIHGRRLVSSRNVCSLPPQANATTTAASHSSYGGKQVIQINQPLYDYVLAHTREPKILCQLREETSSMRGSQMQVSPDQGQFLAMLVGLMGAERCIEVGVYTGYSSLAVAMALPEWGRLVACERDPVSLSVAQKYFELAGVKQKVRPGGLVAIDNVLWHGKVVDSQVPIGDGMTLCRKRKG